MAPTENDQEGTMWNTRGSRSIATLTAAVFASAAGCGGGAAVRVNDAVVTERQIERKVDDQVAQIKSAYARQLGANPNLVRDIREQVRRHVVNQAVDFLVLKTHAKAAGYQADPESVDQYLETIKERYPSDEAFEASLRDGGVTEDDLRKEIAERVVVAKFIDERVSAADIIIEESEVRAFYDENKSDLENKPFSDVRGEIEAHLRQAKEREVIEQLVNRLKESSNIKVGS